MNFQEVCVDKNMIEDNKVYLSLWKPNYNARDILVGVCKIGCIQEGVNLLGVYFLRRGCKNLHR